MNKFEQVSSDGHQMSLVGVQYVGGRPGPGLREGSLSSDVQLPGGVGGAVK